MLLAAPAAPAIAEGSGASPSAVWPTTCDAAGPLPTGTIATIAGNGTAGHSGDGGPATDAAIEPGFGSGVGGDVYTWTGEWFAEKGGPVGFDHDMGDLTSEVSMWLQGEGPNEGWSATA